MKKMSSILKAKPKNNGKGNKIVKLSQSKLCIVQDKYRTYETSGKSNETFRRDE